MRRALYVTGGFFAGGILLFAGGMALPSVVPISQREGAYAMQVAFFWTPLGAMLGAVAGAFLGGRKG